MKNSGISRKIDSLGRVVMPMELRRAFNLDTGADLQIYVEDGRIIFEPIKKGCCAICGAIDAPPNEPVAFNDHVICSSCADQLRTLFQCMDAPPLTKV